MSDSGDSSNTSSAPRATKEDSTAITIESCPVHHTPAPSTDNAIAAESTPTVPSINATDLTTDQITPAPPTTRTSRRARRARRARQALRAHLRNSSTSSSSSSSSSEDSPLHANLERMLGRLKVQWTGEDVPTCEKVFRVVLFILGVLVGLKFGVPLLFILLPCVVQFERHVRGARGNSCVSGFVIGLVLMFSAFFLSDICIAFSIRIGRGRKVCREIRKWAEMFTVFDGDEQNETGE